MAYFFCYFSAWWSAPLTRAIWSVSWDLMVSHHLLAASSNCALLARANGHALVADFLLLCGS